MSQLDALNFHHLRYFWAVAHDGNLTRTAQRLRVAPSALSAQIGTLEAQLGALLFARRGRSLVLTETGQLVLSYADDIFAQGQALLATLTQGRSAQDVLRVGAEATLSRNFQESFLKPLLDDDSVRLSLRAGTLETLSAALRSHDLDVVLSHRTPAHADELVCRAVAAQEVSLVGPRGTRFRFPDDLARMPLLVPGHNSEVRQQFDAVCAQLGMTPLVRAEVDDMATLRLLARDTRGVALLPAVVVRDELRAGVLREYCVVPGVVERFYALTARRAHPHPLLAPLLAQRADALLQRARRRRT